MNIGVIGAGLSGIFAANYLNSKGHDVSIFESNDKIKFHHNGVLRFENDYVPHYLSAEYKKVDIYKNFIFEDKIENKANLSMNNIYSLKTNGGLHRRSILKEDLTNERYILKTSPKLNNGIKVYEGHKFIDFERGFYIFDKIYSEEKGKDFFEFDAVVSTIPLSLFFEDIKFNYNPIYVYSADIEDIESSIYQTYYVIDYDNPIYRITIHENSIIIESVDKIDPLKFRNILSKIGVYKYCGIFSERKTAYGKITNIDDNLRRKSILKLTREKNIYSFGRFAVWKSNLVLDNMLSDIETIDRFIKMGKEEREYECSTY